MSAVVYICWVSGFARRLQGPAIGVIALASVLGAGAIGCGSGHQSTASETSNGAGPAPQTRTSAEAPTTAPATTTDKVSPSGQPQPRHAKAGHEEHEGSGQPARPQAGGPAHGGRHAIGVKAKKDCPSGLSAAQCGALAEAFVKAKEGGSPHPLSEPRDCLQVMSRENCEAMLAAQAAAAESSHSSVGVDECLQNPTPRCEAVLGQMFEEQYAASQEAGK